VRISNIFGKELLYVFYLFHIHAFIIFIYCIPTNALVRIQ
jgi:hypothetical protein